MAPPSAADRRIFELREERGGRRRRGWKGLARLAAAGPPVPGQPRSSQAGQVAGVDLGLVYFLAKRFAKRTLRRKWKMVECFWISGRVRKAGSGAARLLL